MIIHPQEDYYSIPYINATAIKAGANSIKHMVALMRKEPEPPSASMIKGSKMHSFIWSRDDFDKNYIASDLDFRTKEGKEFLKNNNITSENVVRTAELCDLEQALQNVMNHPEASIFFNNEIENEKAIYWKDDKLNGAECKAKLDGYTYKYIIEYKTTSNLNSFIFAAQRLHYNLQFAWYFNAVEQLTGKEVPVYVVVQENKMPFDVAVYKIEIYQLKEWLTECYEIADKYLKEKDLPLSKVSGAYPNLMRFELPNYVEEDDLEVEI